MPVVETIYEGKHVDTSHKPKVIQDPQKAQLISDDASFNREPQVFSESSLL